MDYLISEVTSLPKGEYFLVILGQYGPETRQIQGSRAAATSRQSSNYFSTL